MSSQKRTVFPVVFIFQKVNIIRGKWMAMTLLYFWNLIVIALINDIKLHP